MQTEKRYAINTARSLSGIEAKNFMFCAEFCGRGEPLVNLFGRDLKPYLVGADVRQLHGELVQFGVVIRTPSGKLRNSRERDGTRLETGMVLLHAMASNKGSFLPG